MAEHIEMNENIEIDENLYEGVEVFSSPTCLRGMTDISSKDIASEENGQTHDKGEVEDEVYFIPMDDPCKLGKNVDDIQPNRQSIITRPRSFRNSFEIKPPQSNIASYSKNVKTISEHGEEDQETKIEDTDEFYKNTYLSENVFSKRNRQCIYAIGGAVILIMASIAGVRLFMTYFTYIEASMNITNSQTTDIAEEKSKKINSEEVWRSRFWNVNFLQYFNATFNETTESYVINTLSSGMSLINDTLWISDLNREDKILAYRVIIEETSKHNTIEDNIKTLEFEMHCKREKSDLQCTSVQQASNGDILLVCRGYCKGLYYAKYSPYSMYNHISRSLYKIVTYTPVHINKVGYRDLYAYDEEIYVLEDKYSYCAIHRYTFNGSSSNEQERWQLSKNVILDPKVISRYCDRLIVTRDLQCKDQLCDELLFFVSVKFRPGKGLYSFSSNGTFKQQYGGKNVAGLGKLTTPVLCGIDQVSNLLIIDLNQIKILNPTTGVWSLTMLTGWKPLSGFIDMIPNIDSTDNSTLVWIAKGGPKVIGHQGPTIQVVRYNRITSKRYLHNIA